MRRFEAAVQALGQESPSGASLKRMFAYWERGQRAVTVPVYQRAFEAIYQRSATHLGFEMPTPIVSHAVSQPAPIDANLEHLRRTLDETLTQGGTSDAVIDDWEQMVERYGRATRDRPAALLLQDLGTDLEHLRRSVDGCRSNLGKRRLIRVVAQMSGLLVLTLVKLDDRGAFRRWARTARVAALEAGDPQIESWLLAQEAYGHFYSNDLSEAVVVAEHAQAASTAPGGVGGPLAAALEARARAMLGDGRATVNALERAESMVADLQGEALTPSAFGYNEAQLRFHAGSAYTRLGDVPRAFAAQEKALALCALGDYTDSALTHLDRAACWTIEGDATAAASEVASTLVGLSAEQRQGLIDLRAVEVMTGFSEQQRKLPAVQELRDLVRPA
jgi:tetratricopeptide (TPR) repeat protein